MQYQGPIRIALLLSICQFGCAPKLSEVESVTQKRSVSSSELTAVYPVPMDTQYENNMAEFDRPLILNAVAYARYALEINGMPGYGHTTEVADLARGLVTMATQSNIPQDEALRFRAVVATDEATEHYRQEIERDARTLANGGRLTREAKSVVDGEARLNACMAGGYTAQQCCDALGWVEALAQSDDLVVGESYQATTAMKLSAQQADVDAGQRAQLQPFNQSGIKAWLAYCGGEITQAPGDLSTFKARYGDYHTGTEWVREFHPLSPAKQAGRRIMRRRLQDGTLVSIAESTRDDCSIKETEIIITPPGQQALFWVYDSVGKRVVHAYFPTRRPGEDSVKVAPNACMGCHYTLDTRRFSVAIPSFKALNLTLFDTASGVSYRDHQYCANPGETVIWHDVHAPGRTH